jgi:hypothetical protein
MMSGADLYGPPAAGRTLDTQFSRPIELAVACGECQPLGQHDSVLGANGGLFGPDHGFNARGIASHLRYSVELNA